MGFFLGENSLNPPEKKCGWRLGTAKNDDPFFIAKRKKLLGNLPRFFGSMFYLSGGGEIEIG